MAHIFEVSELTSTLKEVVEAEFPFVWVKGQVSNMAKPASGHVYFSLKDERAVLPVVWFRSSRRDIEAGGIDPLTGEVHEHGKSSDIREGQEVLCAGRLSIYGPRGNYQLIAELVQEQGLGELYARFELLKQKLKDAGYFDPARKRAIPDSPTRVAVITSSRGAAIRDFIRVASDRGTGAQIRVYDTLVQGDAAPGLIAKALDTVSRQGWAELAVLIRGGGSIEDLWAFNEEVVAKAIFECAVPVLTGVGHEVDTTIADLTADRRAATPSHAAQVLWPERRTLAQAIDELEIDLTRSFAGLVERKQASLEQYGRALNWLSPVRRIERAHEALARETRAMVSAAAVLAERKARALDAVKLRLDMAFGPPAIEAQVRNLGDLKARLCRAMDGMAANKEQALALAESGLSAMNPLGPLDRGYALVTMLRTGLFLRSVREAGPGDELNIRVADGSLPATVAQRQDHD